MSRLRIVPIVEGHGEFQCVRILLDRIWRELLGGEHVEVTRPFRWGIGTLVKKDGVQNAVRTVIKMLAASPATDDPTLVLILIDADERCPGEWGPKLRSFALEANPTIDVACVLAKYEYETWFAAAAESLTKYLEFPDGFVASEAPEDARHGKAWVERCFRGPKYSAARDQAGMTSAMNLDLCLKRSPSFGKLCRELERRVRKPSSSA